MVELEADDALASRGARSRPPTTRVEQVIICTPDKDLGQCVGGKVVQLDRRKDDPARRRRRAREVRRAARVDPRLARARRRHRRRLSRASRASAPRRRPRCSTRYGHIEAIPDDAHDVGRAGLRGVDRLAATLARGPRGRRRCSRISRRCAPTPTSARSTTGSGPGPTADFARLVRAVRMRRDSLDARREALRRRRGGSRVSDAVLVETVGDRASRSHAEPARAAQRDELRRSSPGSTTRSTSSPTTATCRVIVLTGAGRGFCAGLDLTEGASPPVGRGPRAARRPGMTVQKLIAGLVPKMRSMPQPIIAAVNGAASGGGLALALASDVRIAAAVGALQRRVHPRRAVGLRHRRVVDAAAPDRRVARVRAAADRPADRRGRSRPHRARHARRRPTATVVDAALETAELIVGNSPFGVRMTKEVMWSQLEIGSLQAGIDLENRTQVLSSFTGDLTEAMAGVRREAAAAASPTSSERASDMTLEGRVALVTGRRAGDRQGDRARARRGRRRRRGQLPARRRRRGARPSPRSRSSAGAARRVRGVGRRLRRVRGDGRRGARRLRPRRHPRQQRRHRVARPDRRRHRSRRDRAGASARTRSARGRAVEARAAVDAHAAARRHRDDLERGDRAHGARTRRRTTWPRPRSRRSRWTLAKEERRNGIHVNVVAPGPRRHRDGPPAGEGRDGRRRHPHDGRQGSRSGTCARPRRSPTSCGSSSRSARRTSPASASASTAAPSNQHPAGYDRRMARDDLRALHRLAGRRDHGHRVGRDLDRRAQHDRLAAAVLASSACGSPSAPGSACSRGTRVS